MAVETPAKSSLWNLPNQLTMSRLVLGVVLFVLIEYNQWVGCLLVFALAAVTDWLDGYYARKLNLVSALGRMLDPLIDKIVVCGAFILLLTKEKVPYPCDGLNSQVIYEYSWMYTGLAGWMVVLVVSREFLVTGIRSFMEQQDIPFGADLWGKLKMILQCAVLIAIFMVNGLGEFLLGWTDPNGYPMFYRWLWIRDVLLCAMLIVTAGSGLNYCWKAAKGLASKTARADNEPDSVGKPRVGRE